MNTNGRYRRGARVTNSYGWANVEKLTFTGTGAFTGTGNNFDNTITSGAGNDILDGGDGNDTLIGGAGNDIYFISTGDVTEVRGASTNSARSPTTRRLPRRSRT